MDEMKIYMEAGMSAITKEIIIPEDHRIHVFAKGK